MYTATRKEKSALIFIIVANIMYMQKYYIYTSDIYFIDVVNIRKLLFQRDSRS